MMLDLGFIHKSVTIADFKFASWEKNSEQQYKKKIRELILNGYRRINVKKDSLNTYEYYKKKGGKKEIVVAILCG